MNTQTKNMTWLSKEHIYVQLLLGNILQIIFNKISTIIL